jgi:citrate lyase synthetase
MFVREENYVAIRDATFTAYFVQEGKLINTSQIF